MRELFRKLVAVLAIVVINISTFPVFAEGNGSTLVINEIQTGSITSASEEFIELYSLSEIDMDISNVRIEYKSATGTNWIIKAQLRGVIRPHSRYLLASQNYLTDRSPELFSSGLAASGGHLRLVSGNDLDIVTMDTIGWGNANSPEGSVAIAPAAGKSIQRSVSELDSVPVDSQDNSVDFAQLDQPTPTQEFDPNYTLTPETQDPETTPPDNETPEPVTEEVDQPADSNAVDDPEIAQDPPAEVDPIIVEEQEQPTENTPPLLGIKINEIFPDPPTPLFDSNDEFVELYNPNSVDVALSSYQLQAGASYSYRQLLNNYTIAAYSYLSITSLDSMIALSNSGSNVRLLGPTGELLDVVSYPEAEEGATWALFDDVWKWTYEPTSATSNIYAPKSVIKSTTAVLNAAKSKVSSKKKIVARKATAKPKKVSSTSPKKIQSNSSRTVYEDAESLDIEQPISKPLLAIVAGGTILYAASEYRHDVQNYIYKRKLYRQTRKATRKPA